MAPLRDPLDKTNPIQARVRSDRVGCTPKKPDDLLRCSELTLRADSIPGPTSPTRLVAKSSSSLSGHKPVAQHDLLQFRQVGFARHIDHFSHLFEVAASDGARRQHGQCTRGPLVQVLVVVNTPARNKDGVADADLVRVTIDHGREGAL